MSFLNPVATIYPYATTETYPNYEAFALSLKEELDRYDDEGIPWETEIQPPLNLDEGKESLEYM